MFFAFKRLSVLANDMLPGLFKLLLENDWPVICKVAVLLEKVVLWQCSCELEKHQL